MDFGEWIGALFGFLGPGGLLVAMFLIFLLDAAIFPALPEVFIVAFYFELTERFGWSPLPAAVALLGLAVAGDLAGNAGLYRLVRFFRDRGRIPPRLEAIMKKWTSLLLVSDERIVLVNRIAPAVPLTGAFIAVLRWDLRKALAYILVGGLVKYSLLLALAVVLGVTFAPETARLVTWSAVVVLVVMSVVAGQVRKRRMQARA
jgi:membrane protein YqaA with SNARE-associated domain